MTSLDQEIKSKYRTNRRQNGVKLPKRRVKKSGKSAYKHVPHSEKPPHLVARRNARERRRVETVNNAFLRLRRHVPIETRHKRLSKVKTLRYAIDYIKRLTSMIDEHDKQYGAPCCNFGRAVTMTTSRDLEMSRILYSDHDVNPDLTSYAWFPTG
ncbi:hypothetical protein ACF0H5_008482 [Mactra antiquata]